MPRGLRLQGQVGVRAETNINQDFARSRLVSDDDIRFRMRMRVRLGATYQPNRHWEIGLRLHNGTGDYPSSGWSTFGDELRRDPIGIDRAYVRARFARDWVTVWLGKFRHPMFAPTELVWDQDIQPEGLAQEIAFGDSGVRLTAGQYMLLEIRDGAEFSNGSVLFAQGLSYTPPLRAVALTLGASSYLYTEPNAIAGAIQAGRLNGDYRTNRIVDDGDDSTTDPFLSDYYLVGGAAELAVKRIPLTVLGEFVANLGANRNRDAGPAFAPWANIGAGAMIRYGRTDEPLRWKVGTGFFYIQSDATIAAFNSDDLQQTNVMSVPVEAQVVVAPGVRVVFDAYIQRKADTDLPAQGGIVHDENAVRFRARLSILGNF